MRWDRSYESPNVEDRRGRGGGVPGLGLLVQVLGRFGWKGLLLGLGIAFVAQRFMARTDAPPPAAPAPGGGDMRSFVGFVLDDAQKTWVKRFEAAGRRYEPAKLVLFTGSTPTGCGYGSVAAGPFYCPRDENVYIDLAFYRELRERFGAPGDFAQAYVLAHEVGHHVQKQLGTLEALEKAGVKQGAGSDQVRVELQADCYAGVWAKSAGERKLLDPGDIEEGMAAAAAVGDDRIQKDQQGRVEPETWTHGSAAQRTAAFQRGFTTGDCQ